MRAVNLGLATGLIGGGMLIPLGAVFSTDVLGAGAAGYGLFTTALGFGVAIGVVGVATLQKRLPKRGVFTGALFCAGISLFCAASASTLPVAVVFVGLMGVSVGPGLRAGVRAAAAGGARRPPGPGLQLAEHPRAAVHPDLDGRRPAARRRSSGGSRAALVEQKLDLAAGTIALPGVRLALWLAALIIVLAGFAALASLRAGQREERAGASPHPSRHSAG